MLPSAAIAFAGYRATRVSHFKDRIDLLEKESVECRAQVARLRSDNEWLMQQVQRHTGLRRPKIDG
jgi:hypothetical protein